MANGKDEAAVKVIKNILILNNISQIELMLGRKIRTIVPCKRTINILPKLRKEDKGKDLPCLKEGTIVYV